MIVDLQMIAVVEIVSNMIISHLFLSLFFFSFCRDQDD